jgi:hypothetical protein
MKNIYIKKFIDKLQQLQAQNAKDYIMSLHDARNLHSDISKLLLELRDNTSDNSTVEIEIKSPSF